ncbi:FtsX-like permease family protein [Candidatus Lokiarchaeum ossiferum]|uniref:FtsX-like permease family protein n=1 Tax=Candidatus Lokiarchaeum ossiferum TaxID=2951803 RepID=UPI00352EFDF7
MSVGIIISIMLISGVDVAANSMAKYMTVQVLDEVKVDFEIQSNEENYTKVLDTLNQLNNSESEFEDFQLAFATSGVDWRSTYIASNDATLNWSNIYDPTNHTGKINHNLLNASHCFGVSDDFFTDPAIGTRFKDTITTNDTFDFTQNGVYVDIKTADFYNLSKGDHLDLGFLFTIYDWEKTEELDEAYYHLASTNITDIPILGIFSLPDPNSFGRLFRTSQWGGSSYIYEDDSVFLGNIDYIENFINIPAMQSFADQLGSLINKLDSWEENPADYEPNYNFGVIIDHEAMAISSPDILSAKIRKQTTRIEQLDIDIIDRVSSNLENQVLEVRLSILLFQGIFMIISLPVIILGWYLCKTNWVLSYQQRRRELALLKVKGGITRQLKGMFYLEAIIVGAIGGLLGIFGGNITSPLVLNQIFPEVVETLTTTTMWGDIFSGRSISRSTWLIGGIGGIALSLIAVRKPLKDFAAMAPIDGLAKYHETSQNQLPKKKKDIVLLIVGILPIAYAIIVNSAVADQFMYYNPFLSLFTGLATILLPLAPFTLIYASVKLLCGNIKIFQKLITSISSVFNKTIAVFTSKSIIRNQARSFRLVFIVAMALSFTVMASTIKESELTYETQMVTIETADGYGMRFYLSEKRDDGVTPFIDYLYQNQAAKQIEAFNFNYNLAGGGLEGETNDNDYYYSNDPSDQPIRINVISSGNFSEYINLNDDWFIDISAQEAMTALQTPNTTLIPESLVDKGYGVGDTIKAEYQEHENHTSILVSLTVVGIYKVLPLVSSGYSYSQKLVIDQTTASNGYSRDTLDFAFYGIDGNESTFSEDNFENMVQDYDQYAGAYKAYDYDDEFATMGSSLIRFLNLESIYLVTIVTFGIAIIMYISINEKSHDMGLLRARGVERKVLYKIQIAEGGTLIFMGSLFTFMGIIGGAAMILQLNNLFMMDGGAALERTLKIPWLTILWQLGLALVLFIISIAIAVAIETRKSDVTKIGELLRVDA